MENCFHERVLYYWRHGLYGHVQLLCELALKVNNNDLFLHIWNSLSFGILGQTEAAMKEISRVKCRSDLSLLLVVSQICIINSSICPNTTKNEELLKLVDELLPSSNNFCISQSAQVAWMFNNLSLLIKILSALDEPMPISGWVKLANEDYTGAEKIFNTILNEKIQSFDLLSLYGKFIICTATLRITESLEIYGKIISRYFFPEIDIDRARNSARYGKWDQALAVAEEVRKSLPTTLEVDIFSAINFLTKSASLKDAVIALGRIRKICETTEQTNWFLNVRLAQVFGSLACKNMSIIDCTMKMAQIAHERRPDYPLCASVLAYHQIMTRNYGVAEETLSNEAVMNYENSNMTFNSHLRLLLEMNRLDELEDALDLYSKVVVDDEDFLLSTFKTILARRRGLPISQYIPNIILALRKEYDTSDVKEEFEPNVFMPLEVQYERFFNIFISLRLDLVFDAFNEIAVLNRSVRTPPTGKIGDEIESIISIINNSISGYIPLQFVQASLYLKQGRYYESQYLFQVILISKWQYHAAQCLVSLAEIDILHDQFSFAKIKIDEALSLDTNLKNDYYFHMVRTAIYRNREHLILMIPFFTSQVQPLSSVLDFIDLAISMRAFKVAKQVFCIVAPNVTHPADKSALILRQAKICAGNNNFEKALKLLTKLKSHSRFRDSAVFAESEIRFINNNMNKDKIDGNSFIDVLKYLQIQDPSPKHSEMVANAYSKILDFDKAADYYKLALDYPNPSADTFQKYISSLVSAHRFDEAVDEFINNFQKLNSNSFTLVFLIKELINFKRYESAKKCIKTGEKLINKFHLISYADFNEQCGIVSWKLQELGEAETFFNNSLIIYENIIKEASINAFVSELKSKAASMFVVYADFCASQLRREKANSLYYKAIDYDKANSRPVLSLIEYYKAHFEVHKCIHLCTEFLNRFPNDEEIALQLTSFETSDYAHSIKCLVRVFKAHPHFHRILIRLVEICARAGKLFVVAKRITRDPAPGMIFARGLFLMYNGRCDDAIACFYRIEKDQRWGDVAKHGIFNLLVNPGRQYIWCTKGPLSTEDRLARASRLLEVMSISSNDKLLCQAEIEQSRNTDMSVETASLLYHLAIEKQQESSTSSSTGTASVTANHSKNLPALVGLSRCNIRLGKPQQADIFIDKVLQGKPYHETFSYFEEVYLMRAQIVMNEKNFKAAQHFNFKALKLNLSCKKGWEFSAEAHKQSHMYEEAANSYMHCWELSGRNDPEIGYQFAYCAMNAGRPEDALEMCRVINDIHPFFKDIREKILIPSFQKLKP